MGGLPNEELLDELLSGGGEFFLDGDVDLGGVILLDGEFFLVGVIFLDGDIDLGEELLIPDLFLCVFFFVPAAFFFLYVQLLL